MGSGPSKSAAQSTIRRFPNRAPGTAVPPSSSNSAAARAANASRRPDPTNKKPVQASSASDQAMRHDGSVSQTTSPDTVIQPDLAQRLRDMGVVQPNPTYSPSSTASHINASPLQQTQNSGPIFPSPSQNGVLSTLQARQKLQREADEELESMGTSNAQGRRFLSAGLIRDVLIMRERGASAQDIEHRFNLKQGLVRNLGPKGLYRPASMTP